VEKIFKNVPVNEHNSKGIIAEDPCNDENPEDKQNQHQKYHIVTLIVIRSNHCPTICNH
jgi:hypothetical protein